MKRLILAAGIPLAVAVPAVALAKHPTQQHVSKYKHDYSAVRQQFGHRAPGRNIVKDGLSTGKALTDARLVTSLDVLGRMLAPPPPPPAPAPVATSSDSTSQTPIQQAPAQQTASSGNGSSTPSSGLTACIIQHESGGNPQAVSGQYQGIGQWSPEAWAQDGGTRYAPSPTGASYDQQLSVLNGEGTAGMQQQQAQYDGC